MGCIITLSVVSIPAAKAQELRLFKREDARTSMQLSLTSTARAGISPPPSVSRRAMAPSEFPRRRGLCPSGGACSPWGPVFLFWVVVGPPPFAPSITALREGSSPALGSALRLPQRSGHLTSVSTLQVAHPGRGARRCWGWHLRRLGCVYGSFVAILLQARGCLCGHPASGRNKRPSPFLIKTRAL